MVTSIGMMDAAYFVGRTEILAWINSTLHLNLSKVEEGLDMVLRPRFMPIFAKGDTHESWGVCTFECTRRRARQSHRTNFKEDEQLGLIRKALTFSGETCRVLGKIRRVGRGINRNLDRLLNRATEETCECKT
ncbi:hypothetical protein Scep_004676 [Stephania cephalantha]|uniref:Uncharacterized protein n=1 Tax=Stephania cephalantha TaxID=152367 RepID=A0AAP0KUM4_9MAGN